MLLMRKPCQCRRTLRWSFGIGAGGLFFAGVAALLYLPPEAAVPPRDVASELLAAVRIDDYVQTGFLLGQGADAQAVNAAFRLAAETGSLEVMKVLLDAEADGESTDALGRTPLMLAAGNRRCAAVRLLLERGADPDHGSRSGQTALLAACAAGDCGVLETLLNGGAALWPGVAEGRGPLVTALRGKHVEAAELLLSRGADPNERDAAGNSALQLAAGLQAPGLMEKLRAAGAYEE